MQNPQIPSFAQARVLVAGDVMLDRYWHGPTGRISPEAPVPVVRVTELEDRPGGAANVALNMAALGARAELVGVTGRDEAASILEERLAAAEVGCHFQKVDGLPTITKLRVISRQQQLLRLDFEEAFHSQDPAPFAEQVKQQLSHCGALVLSDYAKGALRDCPGLIALAREAGVPVLVDPKGTDFEPYRGATLLTPNLSEFEAVVGAVKDEQDLIEKGQQLIRDLDLQAMLVTRSEKGMTLLRDGLPELHLPARAREVFDVTGAGDTVISVLAVSLAAGAAMEDAVALANIAAGIVVGKLGTAVVSAPELRRAVHQEGGLGRGVMTEAQLLIAIEDARAQGEKIVFTNGCFDIIHAGHVGYLDTARRQGDRLVLAVNGDESIRRLKGPGRPINPLERRMAVLAALEAVDWVVAFDTDTPEPLLDSIKPDVLVKGGDYSVDQVVGHEFVKGYGGEVKVLDFIDDISTTKIVERIRKDNE
ncbi:bifunctional D-glycero-beta-D-manno-heptose-7-phosphate kinase/D-glycero-beta-D-manno-heptose 1-phosphate adenylyltransferase HldE [Alcanivorax sp. DG881]|jgi:D-beta-D-heptose 7-phosphate kinase/D-beta-D-heptose 1-phosphate adenosyltransferase|uniref:bifunctional D-glycero-beta-D-manno-heptose-7-phosphate kinase/D-glycero-beta-D-manno-heptose 1-phosphate adenylyltransferase HldE n=1 Tax=Alcanivorax sp. DG881 TaxID=236097 RepID=UPI00017EE881|nr:bifunctional D-glycero-beta-D-manno-heptose-7-phosphate kinase/D-glycero-beta-D-manno-heptose 1-phosphate adenylyltransferase HldE [Alcanivorax sp. DG881]EDX89990.1 kinase, pfkB family [Alcanivorax sp. DG881]